MYTYVNPSGNNGISNGTEEGTNGICDYISSIKGSKISKIIDGCGPLFGNVFVTNYTKLPRGPLCPPLPSRYLDGLNFRSGSHVSLELPVLYPPLS